MPDATPTPTRPAAGAHTLTPEQRQWQEVALAVAVVGGMHSGATPRQIAALIGKSYGETRARCEGAWRHGLLRREWVSLSQGGQGWRYFPVEASGSVVDAGGRGAAGA